MKSECPKCDGAGVIRGACIVPQSYYAPAEYEAIDCPNPDCHDGAIEVSLDPSFIRNAEMYVYVDEETDR